MGKGLVSGLSFECRLELCHLFKSSSIHKILEFFPPEIGEDMEIEIWKSRYKDIIWRGMGRRPDDNAIYSMNIFKHRRKDKIIVDIDRQLDYIPYEDLWDGYNYDGFIRGKRLCDLFNATKNKDEKFYYLLQAGMCNFGYCNSRNPFGILKGDPETGWHQNNYDLQFRMYQLNHMKYKTIPADIKDQLKKRGRVKTKNPGMYQSRTFNWKQHDVSNMENKIFIPKKLTFHERGLRLKVKEERLMKGKYLECEEISKKYQEIMVDHWYNPRPTGELIYFDEDMYNDKPILKEWFRKTYPYHPSYFDPNL